jgi:hypothetical protein
VRSRDRAYRLIDDGTDLPRLASLASLALRKKEFHAGSILATRTFRFRVGLCLPGDNAASLVIVAFVLLAGQVSVRLLQPRPTALVEGSKSSASSAALSSSCTTSSPVTNGAWPRVSLSCSSPPVRSPTPDRPCTAWPLMPGGVG